MNENENCIISFDEGVDATYRSYNFSMNFWYVAGEVYFTADVQLPQTEEGTDLILSVMAKSPVNEWVNTELRIRKEGSEASEKPAVLRSEQVYTKEKEVSFDLTEYAGQSVQLEFAYVWDQASLLTIVPRTPAAQLRTEGRIEVPAVTEEPTVTEEPAVTEEPTATEEPVVVLTATPAPVTQEIIEVSVQAVEKTFNETAILPAIAFIAITAWIGIKRFLKKR